MSKNKKALLTFLEKCELLKRQNFISGWEISEHAGMVTLGVRVSTLRGDATMNAEGASISDALAKFEELVERRNHEQAVIDGKNLLLALPNASARRDPRFS